MALSISTKLSPAGFISAATTTTTASVTTVTGRLYVMCITASLACTAISTGAGCVWTKTKEQATSNGGNGVTQTWTALCTAGGSSTFVISNVSASSAMAYAMFEISGNTATPVRQALTSSSESSPISLAMAAAGPPSMMFMVVAQSNPSSATQTITPKAGYTTLTTQNIGGGIDQVMKTAWLNAYDSSPNATFSPDQGVGAGYPAGMIVLEIAGTLNAFGASPAVGSRQRMGFGV